MEEAWPVAVEPLILARTTARTPPKSRSCWASTPSSRAKTEPKATEEPAQRQTEAPPKVPEHAERAEHVEHVERAERVALHAVVAKEAMVTATAQQSELTALEETKTKLAFPT
jgi:hypothetical protein